MYDKLPAVQSQTSPKFKPALQFFFRFQAFSVIVRFKKPCTNLEMKLVASLPCKVSQSGREISG